MYENQKLDFKYKRFQKSYDLNNIGLYSFEFFVLFYFNAILSILSSILIGFHNKKKKIPSLQIWCRILIRANTQYDFIPLSNH